MLKKYKQKVYALVLLLREMLMPWLLLGLLLGLWLVLLLWLGQWLWLGLMLVLGLRQLLWLLLGLVLGLWRLLQRFSSNESSPLTKFDSLFPEEWRNDLETQIKRMRKAGKPERFIKRRQIRVRLSWILGFARIKLENLWLPKNRRS
jgi:hypothetical protein